MTDKHTPGPWTVSPDNSRVVQGEGRRIALAYSHAIQPGAVGDANARLIAAAPELLEALEQAVRYLEHPDVTALPFALPVTNVSRVARAAIEAAKGEK